MNNGKLEWTNEKKIWNWDHCTIGLVKSPEKKLRVVVRSNANKNQIRGRVLRIIQRYGADREIDGYSSSMTIIGFGSGHKREWTSAPQTYIRFTRT